MNLSLLNTAIKENTKCLSIFYKELSLDLKDLTLEEQKVALDYFKDGTMEFSFFNAQKTTERSFVHITIKKEFLEVNVGFFYLPELRKPTKKQSNGWAFLMSELITDATRPKSTEKLSRENLSMFFYILPLFNLSNIELVSGKRGESIPEKYNTIEKIMNHANLEKFLQFKID